MIDYGTELYPIEVKLGKTISSDYFKTINYWLNLKNNPQESAALIYGGDEWLKRNNIQMIPWYAVS